jgi:hypothetical protein
MTPYHVSRWLTYLVQQQEREVQGDMRKGIETHEPRRLRCSLHYTLFANLILCFNEHIPRCWHNVNCVAFMSTQPHKIQLVLSVSKYVWFSWQFIVKCERGEIIYPSGATAGKRGTRKWGRELKHDWPRNDCYLPIFSVCFMNMYHEPNIK